MFSIPGYSLRSGSSIDRALLVKFMQRTYQELHPGREFVHLAYTVEQYLSTETALWWVAATSAPTPIACLWLGNAVDQVTADRHAYIFLLYVSPDHRHQGIGSALMNQAEFWAKQRGDRQIGLQVFSHNQPALNLYQKLGYQTQSIWMVKPL
jgi:ribosomal protein S18 acetylase RimI-like enzyme